MVERKRSRGYKPELPLVDRVICAHMDWLLAVGEQDPESVRVGDRWRGLYLLAVHRLSESQTLQSLLDLGCPTPAIRKKLALKIEQIKNEEKKATAQSVVTP